jgi:hypothetical protein
MNFIDHAPVPDPETALMQLTHESASSTEWHANRSLNPVPVGSDSADFWVTMKQKSSLYNSLSTSADDAMDADASRGMSSGTIAVRSKKAGSVASAEFDLFNSCAARLINVRTPRLNPNNSFQCIHEQYKQPGLHSYANLLTFLLALFS